MTNLTTQGIVMPPAPDRKQRFALARKVGANPLGLIAILILVLVVLASIFAPLLAPHSPNTTDLTAVLQGPSAQHPLGTDGAGRDVLSRLLWGGRVTLLAALLATVVATVVGVGAGLLAGYFGGTLDWFSSWGAAIMLSLPAIVILLAVRAVAGPSVWITMIMFGLITSPTFFRLVRASVQTVRNELYVDAARVAGLGDTRIITRHIASVVRAPIIVQLSIVAGIAIAVQSALEFLGMGDPSVPVWGSMLNDAFRNIYLQPLGIVWPALAIVLVTMACGLLANAVRDALEDRPRLRGSRSRKKVASPSQRGLPLDDQPIPDAMPESTGFAVAPLPGLPADAALEPPLDMGPDSSDDRTLVRPRGAMEDVEDDDGVGLAREERPGEILTVDKLSVGYPTGEEEPRAVVRDVSFGLLAGEVVGIVGESGSGKSQTAFSILGLLPREAMILSGSILIDGVEMIDGRGIDEKKIGPLRGDVVSYIPQEPMSNLDPNYTVGHQLIRPMRVVLGMSKKDAKERALTLLRRVGIVDPERTFRSYPHEISGGMAQRVLIAGAVSCRPRIIIADEPTTALDVTVQAEVLDLLREMQQATHSALMIVTHNFGVVADICDRVVVMQHGRVVEAGDVRDVLRRPQHPYTKSLLAATLEGKTPLTLLAGQEEAN